MPQVFVSMQSRLTVLRDQQGQTMAEYGVVLAVIMLVVVGALMALGGGINGALEEVTGISSPDRHHDENWPCKSNPVRLGSYVSRAGARREIAGCRPGSWPQGQLRHPSSSEPIKCQSQLGCPHALLRQ